MNVVFEFLSEHGPRLTLGVSAVLAVGCLLVWSVQQPVFKQRLAELSVFAALLWLALAVLPMDRRTKPIEAARLVAPPMVPDSSPEFSVPVPTPPLRPVTDPISPLMAEEPMSRPIDGFASQPPAEADIPVEEPTPAATAPSFPWAAAAFLLAAGVSLLGLAASFVRLRRLAARSKSPDARTLLRWESLDPPEHCRLLVSPRATPPLSFGLLRPTVCIPETLPRDEDRSLTSVLAHELAHIRHGDALGRTVFNVGLPFFALHPLYWMLRSEAVFASELRADAAAAESEGEAEYVESLLSVFQRGGRVRPLLSASTVWSSQSAFSRRMTMLLERKNPVRQDTPKALKAFGGLAAVAGAAFFASQFGVVYAQAEKVKSNDAVKTTVVTPLRSVDANGVAKFNPIDVGGKTVETTISADGRYAKLSSEYASIPDEGSAPSNNLSLSIAERKAKLAAAKFTNEFRPEVLIRMEVELIHLEAAKRIEAYESEIREAEAKLRRLADDFDEARSKLGDSHPTREKVANDLRRTEEQVKRLKDAIEGCNHEAEIRSKRAADSMMAAGKQLAASNTSAKFRPVVMPPDSKDAGTDLAAAMQEIARLKKENEDLKRRLSVGQPSALKTKEAPAKTSSEYKPTNDAASPINWLQTENASLRDLLAQVQIQSTRPAPSSESLAATTSVPLLKHRLRMAQTEPQILERRLAWAMKESERMEKLHKSGAVSFEEVAKVRLQLEVTQAELEKAKVEIGSLMKLIEELENSNQKAAAKPMLKTQ